MSNLFPSVPSFELEGSLIYFCIPSPVPDIIGALQFLMKVSAVTTEIKLENRLIPKKFLEVEPTRLGKPLEVKNKRKGKAKSNSDFQLYKA